MNTAWTYSNYLPEDQKRIRAKCFHPSGSFMEFTKHEIECSISERFEKIALKYPDHIAVEMAETSLTYSELNGLANRTAYQILMECGAKAEPIALLFDKGIELLAAMIGVLKAGKFFVLLDPSYPESRSAAVLQASEAKLLISTESKLSTAQRIAPSSCRVVDLALAETRFPAENPALSLSPQSTTCIMYTSGSTGEPKGVVWTQRNWLHKIMQPTNQFHICDHDRITLLSSHSPNALTTMFLVLLNGAALCPFDVRKDGLKSLAEWLSDKRISVCLMGSPLFRAFCNVLSEEARFPELRLLRIGSEVVYKSDLELFKKHFTNSCVFATGLGMAETGYVRIFFADHDTEIAGSEVPVGYAEDDKEIVLLDESGQKVGFNQIAEITVKSPYFSEGYWRNPELTSVKFKPDDSAKENKLYLTGDLGLMLPDGCLLHKGRKDFRVKVRGYSVEIAEVERAILRHDSVKEAVVVGRVNESGEQRLIAYLTCFSNDDIDFTKLRGFLRQHLPEYMVPSAFVTLDQMPMTADGKVDRRALPETHALAADLGTSHKAPITPFEIELARLWSAVLAPREFGVSDSFFDVGGDSLSASKLLTAIKEFFKWSCHGSYCSSIRR